MYEIPTIVAFFTWFPLVAFASKFVFPIIVAFFTWFPLVAFAFKFVRTKIWNWVLFYYYTISYYTDSVGDNLFFLVFYTTKLFYKLHIIKKIFYNLVYKKQFVIFLKFKNIFI
jgi:hypothetical protein